MESSSSIKSPAAWRSLSSSHSSLQVLGLRPSILGKAPWACGPRPELALRVWLERESGGTALLEGEASEEPADESTLQEAVYL